MFHKLGVERIINETEVTVSIEFSVPDELKDDFLFKAGQYLTLNFVIDGKEERRSYSICSAPHEGHLKIAAKVIPNGKVSTYLNSQLKEGDEVEAMIPMGHFIMDTEHKKKTHVAFAAGSGITPVISIIKDVLKNEPKSEFILYYGNRTADSIIFKDELEALENEYKKTFKKRFKVHHYLSQGQSNGSNFYAGRISKTVLEDAIWRHIRADEFYMCGPEAMTMTARDILSSKAINEKNVHFELFTTSAAIKPKEVEAEENVASIGKAQVTVVLDGVETKFDMDPKESVLHAAIDQGLDVPYACQGGTCCTCQAMVMDGKVEMDLNLVLSDDEIEKGYVLTCQSHPTTDSVTINYDNN